MKEGIIRFIKEGLIKDFPHMRLSHTTIRDCDDGNRFVVWRRPLLNNIIRITSDRLCKNYTTVLYIL